MQAMYIWKNGEMCPWDQAQIHVLSHALHYGSSVFEGLRAYDIEGNPAIFCGPQHFERLLFSCKVARIPAPLTVDQWMSVTAETLSANRQSSAYIRPLVFRGCGDSLGLDARSCPVEAILATVPWGTYLGDSGLQEGVNVQVSSWRRSSSGATSALAKIGGQYTTAHSIVAEAHDNGFHEGISLDSNGHVSEGSGENIFLIYKEKLFTPPVGDSILAGITRNCVISIANDMKLPVIETTIPREMLYLAEELFFTGTAVEVCPIRSVDRMPVADGRPGPITKAIQEIFFGIIRGTYADKWGWLTPVRAEVPSNARRLRS